MVVSACPHKASSILRSVDRTEAYVCVCTQQTSGQIGREEMTLKSSAEKLKMEPTATQHDLHIIIEEGAQTEMFSSYQVPIAFQVQQEQLQTRQKDENKTIAR